MKKFYCLIAVLCLSVTTLMATPVDTDAKTEKIFSFEKSTDVKQNINVVVSSEGSEDFVVQKKDFKLNYDAVFLNESFTTAFLVKHNYGYHEKLKSNFIVDHSRLISKTGLMKRKTNYC